MLVVWESGGVIVWIKATYLVERCLGGWVVDELDANIFSTGFLRFIGALL